MKSALISLLIAIDKLAFFIVTFGRCRRGETISAAAWSLDQDGKWQGKLFRPLIDFLLSWYERDHCHQAWLAQKELYP